VSDAHDHLLRALWRKDRRIYKTVGIIYDPAVVIEDVASGEQETHVIGCLNYEQIERLLPENEPVLFVDPFQGRETADKPEWMS